MYEYAARIKRVVDADTLVLEVDLGMHIRVEVTTRLAGVNAPELRTVEGQAARAFVEQLVAAGGPEVTVRTVKDREKWGRYLAEVRWPAAPSTLSELLLSAGHAVVMT